MPIIFDYVMQNHNRLGKLLGELKRRTYSEKCVFFQAIPN